LNDSLLLPLSNTVLQPGDHNGKNDIALAGFALFECPSGCRSHSWHVLTLKQHTDQSQ